MSRWSHLGLLIAGGAGIFMVVLCATSICCKSALFVLDIDHGTTVEVSNIIE